MYVLDTDLIVIIQRGTEPAWSRLRNRMELYDHSNYYLTVVSVHEQTMGGHNYISRAKNRSQVVRGYRMFEWAMLTYNDYKVLPFDEPSAIRFDELRNQGVRIGTMDLRIASIALSHDLTLLTRNTVDFAKVPGLRIEDWTVDS